MSRCPCERLLSLSPALNLHWTSGALNKSRGKFPRAASCFERGCASLHPAARRNGKACASAVAAGWPERKPYLRSGVQARCFCPQAIAHYEQAADYYKGEESNRQVGLWRGRAQTGARPGWPTRALLACRPPLRCPLVGCPGPTRAGFSWRFSSCTQACLLWGARSGRRASAEGLNAARCQLCAELEGFLPCPGF